MKRVLVLSALVAGLSIAVSASAAPRTGTLVIRHQARGCHTWSFNGGAFKATQRIQLARGASVVIENNDVMPHRLVKTSGPAIAVKLVTAGTMGPGMMRPPFARGMMGRMGATVKVTFTTKGVYRLKTQAGEDYMPMGDEEDEGEDYVLRLIVTVS